MKVSDVLKGGELLGGLLLLAGLVLASWCAILFLTLGRGTPAIIHPPEKLVVSGPYGFVRNPMMTGAFLMLLGEALLFGFLLLLLFVFFIALPVGYPLIRYEEEELEERFGDSYREYKKRVPRLLPRLRRRDEERETL
ncbi:MAG: methyltransferase [Acidobacteriota bacterium]